MAAPTSSRGVFSSAIDNILYDLQNEHQVILDKLSTDSQLSNDDLTTLGKRSSQIAPVVERLSTIESLEEETGGLIELLDQMKPAASNDADEKELREMAEIEIEENAEKIEALESEILILLVPKDEIDDKGVVLEVKAGTGGDEAALFAMEVFQMYQKFSALQGWRFEVLSMSESDLGGCNSASATVSGMGAYGMLKFESGTHRVQRIPQTEKAGRMQTSAVAVAVMPEVKDVDLVINNSDLRIDVYRASGAGGQHVNTTESAVRITHLPTNTVVAIQDERSQHKNKAKAMKLLASRIYEAEHRRKQAENSATKSALFGSGDRSDRIRTYNFPQNRITDHRINYSANGVDTMMNGELLPGFVEALLSEDNDNKVKALESGSGNL
jgi:peptide chain release factor 1